MMRRTIVVLVALLLVNKRGVERNAMIDTLPATWISRFGNVSFNQYGRDFPIRATRDEAEPLIAVGLI